MIHTVGVPYPILKDFIKTRDEIRDMWLVPVREPWGDMIHRLKSHSLTKVNWKQKNNYLIEEN